MKNIPIDFNMSHKNKFYKNKMKNLVSTAGILLIIAAIGSVYVPTNHHAAHV
jgi:hypothetical protein